MKFFIVILLFLSYKIYSQNEFNSFGTDSTLDIITWNVQDFPKNENTFEYLKEMIEILNVDVIAFQEITDSLMFNKLISELSLYDGFVKIDYILGLVYLYNKNTIKVDSIYQIYTEYEHWNNFPRAPMILSFKFNNEEFSIINNHLKCCGDGKLGLNQKYDEEWRRYQAMGNIFQYASENIINKNHIILGDLNDEITDDEENNVFRYVFNNPDKYMFTDYEIAIGDSNLWSYPSYPSHLDHIIINNSLFDNFNNVGSICQTILAENYFEGDFQIYDENVSDHRPVGIRLNMNNYYNSIREKDNYYIKNNILYFNEIEYIYIYNLYGQLIYRNSNMRNIDLSQFENGFYLLISNNHTSKLIIE